MRNFVSGILFAVLFLWPQSLDALTIAPLRQTIVLGSGQVQTVAVEVRNSELMPVSVAGEVTAFSLDHQGKISFDVADEAVDWIQSAPKKLTLQPNQNGKIFFTVRAPVTGLAESHYVVLFVKELAETSQIAVGQRVGSLLFIHPAGVSQELVEINYWYPGQSWHHSGKIDWFLRLHNKSTIHVLPKIEVEVHTFWGKFVYTKTVLAQGIILPDGSLEKKWTDVGLPWWAIGPLRFDLSVIYGLNQKVEHITQIVWYWPRVLAISGLLLVGVIIIFQSVIRFRRHGLCKIKSSQK